MSHYTRQVVTLAPRDQHSSVESVQNQYIIEMIFGKRPLHVSVADLVVGLAAELAVELVVELAAE